MSAPMTRHQIERDNQRFQGTGGISQNNQALAFRPAFRDCDTGRVELSRFATGVPAPMHLLCGLPEDWVLGRNPAGMVVSVKSSIVAGFLCDGHFYTREQAVRTLSD